MFPRGIFLLTTYKLGQLQTAFFLSKTILIQSSEITELSAQQKKWVKKPLPAFHIKDLTDAYNDKNIMLELPTSLGSLPT